MRIERAGLTAEQRANHLFATENPVVEYTILKPEGVLLLKPDSSLSKAHFAGPGASVDAHLAGHASLRGALINKVN